MSIQAFTNVSGIDTKQGLTNCMDDEDLYTSIVSMYVDQLIEDVPKLTQASSNNDWIEIGKLAHAVKGASASVGAFEIQQAASEIEKAAKNNDSDTIINSFDAFITLLNTTITALKQAL